eukprot:TRINITY_DN5861_c0_g2_i7.p3 TRINITY_DN5861_c0_g2~~TRINITY_DN5861_c0_g2_i7.p3  ORF type:complete len:244 (-),score=-9.34 TRINITY_DN5861_c0_g2_i7:172-903(-)
MKIIIKDSNSSHLPQIFPSLCYFSYVIQIPSYHTIQKVCHYPSQIGYPNPTKSLQYIFVTIFAISTLYASKKQYLLFLRCKQDAFSIVCFFFFIALISRMVQNKTASCYQGTVARQHWYTQKTLTCSRPSGRDYVCKFQQVYQEGIPIWEVFGLKDIVESVPIFHAAITGLPSEMDVYFVHLTIGPLSNALKITLFQAALPLLQTGQNSDVLYSVSATMESQQNPWCLLPQQVCHLNIALIYA